MKFRDLNRLGQLFVWLVLTAILATTVLATIRLIGTNANTVFSQVEPAQH